MSFRITPYRGTLLGILFTAGSLLSIYTFVVPIVSVLPGLVVELLSSVLVSNQPYRYVGVLTIALLSVLFLSSWVFFLKRLYDKKKAQQHISTTSLFNILLVEYFILHALGFYVYWATQLDFRADGQLIFAAVDSFSYSSWAFIPLGILIDLIKNSPGTSQLSDEQER